MAENNIKPNLADPDFEPTEAQLGEVMRTMINAVKEKHKLANETMSVKSQVELLAKVNGVTYKRTRLDVLADDITRLSGDDVVIDDTGHLIIALKRAGIIDRTMVADLIGRHLDQIGKNS